MSQLLWKTPTAVRTWSHQSLASSQTQIITDVKITHPCTQTHDFQPNSHRDAEALKNRLYVANSWHGFISSGLQLFWSTGPRNAAIPRIVADRAAQRVVSLPDFSLPAAADLPGVVDEHASLLQLDQHRRQLSFRRSVQEVLVAIFEAVCERVT